LKLRWKFDSTYTFPLQNRTRDGLDIQQLTAGLRRGRGKTRERGILPLPNKNGDPFGIAMIVIQTVLPPI
jgi:hypothetical protein